MVASQGVGKPRELTWLGLEFHARQWEVEYGLFNAISIPLSTISGYFFSSSCGDGVELTWPASNLQSSS